jgi:hypothetical protein
LTGDGRDPHAVRLSTGRTVRLPHLELAPPPVRSEREVTVALDGAVLHVRPGHGGQVQAAAVALALLTLWLAFGILVSPLAPPRPVSAPTAMTSLADDARGSSPDDDEQTPTRQPGLSDAAWASALESPGPGRAADTVVELVVDHSGWVRIAAAFGLVGLVLPSLFLAERQVNRARVLRVGHSGVWLDGQPLPRTSYTWRADGRRLLLTRREGWQLTWSSAPIDDDLLLDLEMLLNRPPGRVPPMPDALRRLREGS